MNCIILYLSSSFTLQTLQCIKCMYVTAKYRQQHNNSRAAGRAYCMGVNSTAFGRKLTLFSAIPLSRLSLKMSHFFAYFELEKMRSRCALFSVKWNSDDSATSFHCSTKLIRSYICKSVKLCVFCLFVQLRLSPGRVKHGIKISRVIVAWAKSV